MRKYRFLQARHVPSRKPGIDGKINESAVPHSVGQVISGDEISAGHLHSLVRQRVLEPIEDPAALDGGAPAPPEEQAPTPETAKPAKGKKAKKKKDEAGGPAPAPEEGAVE